MRLPGIFTEESFYLLDLITDQKKKKKIKLLEAKSGPSRGTECSALRTCCLFRASSRRWLEPSFTAQGHGFQLSLWRRCLTLIPWDHRSTAATLASHPSEKDPVQANTGPQRGDGPQWCQYVAFRTTVLQSACLAGCIYVTYIRLKCVSYCL